MRIAIFLILFFLPWTAYGYVDPGILSALYQLFYISIFAILSVIIFRPWALLKSKLSRLRDKRKAESPDDPHLP
jgi:hypothetical protein